MNRYDTVLMKIVHRTFNEMIICAESYAGALGLVPRGDLFYFKIYDGRQQEEVLRRGSFTALASMSSLDYVRAVIEKRCPEKWYLRFDCDLVYCERIKGAFVCSCRARDPTFKPAPPPKRTFFFVLEVLIALTKAWAGLEVDVDLVEHYVREVERLGEEEDLEALKIIRKAWRLVDPPGFEPGTSALRGRRSSS